MPDSFPVSQCSYLPRLWLNKQQIFGANAGIPRATKCVELDAEIEHFRELASAISDR